MTYAKKSAFFQKPLFLGKANLKGSLETQGIYRALLKNQQLVHLTGEVNPC